MKRTAADDAEERRGERDLYAFGYQAGAHEWMAVRTASEWAGFFLPSLRTGMRLLDCGCGPGSITVGLAEVVAPGEVVGIDIEPKQVETSRALAQSLGLTNVRFEVGSLYELPFPDASFDAAFAGNVLEHLADPLPALREMRRVLRPGGVVGVRDTDLSTERLEPHTPDVQAVEQIFLRMREDTSSPYYAPQQRALLRRAGFVPGQAFVFALCQSTPQALHAASRLMAEFLTNPTVVTMAVQRGWADQVRLEALRAYLEAWPDQPDALRAIMHFASVGRVPEESNGSITL